MSSRPDAALIAHDELVVALTFAFEEAAVQVTGSELLQTC